MFFFLFYNLFSFFRFLLIISNVGEKVNVVMLYSKQSMCKKEGEK